MQCHAGRECLLNKAGHECLGLERKAGKGTRMLLEALDAKAAGETIGVDMVDAIGYANEAMKAISDREQSKSSALFGGVDWGHSESLSVTQQEADEFISGQGDPRVMPGRPIEKKVATK